MIPVVPRVLCSTLSKFSFPSFEWFLRFVVDIFQEQNAGIINEIHDDPNSPCKTSIRVSRVLVYVALGLELKLEGKVYTDEVSIVDIHEFDHLESETVDDLELWSVTRNRCLN